MTQRGDQGMGFSHSMTGHHFHLCSDGGVIEVESNSPDDDASKGVIRRHMQKIADMFARGDFSLPMFIHDTVPPSVETITMKHLKDQITYMAEKTARGAQMRIATRSPQALIAVHQFLRSRSRITVRVTRSQYKRPPPSQASPVRGPSELRTKW